MWCGNCGAERNGTGVPPLPRPHPTTYHNASPRISTTTTPPTTTPPLPPPPFPPIQTCALAFTILLTIAVVQDGRSNWLKGAVLLVTFIFVSAGFAVHKDSRLTTEEEAHAAKAAGAATGLL